MVIFSGPESMCGIAGPHVTSATCVSWKLHAGVHSGFIIYIPTKIVGGFPFLYILCRSFYFIFIICRSFDDGCCDQCEVIPYCRFDWH